MCRSKMFLYGIVQLVAGRPSEEDTTAEDLQFTEQGFRMVRSVH